MSFSDRLDPLESSDSTTMSSSSSLFSSSSLSSLLDTPGTWNDGATRRRRTHAENRARKPSASRRCTWIVALHLAASRGRLANFSHQEEYPRHSCTIHPLLRQRKPADSSGEWHGSSSGHLPHSDGEDKQITSAGDGHHIAGLAMLPCHTRHASLTTPVGGRLEVRVPYTSVEGIPSAARATPVKARQVQEDEHGVSWLAAVSARIAGELLIGADAPPSAAGQTYCRHCPSPPEGSVRNPSRRMPTGASETRVAYREVLTLGIGAAASGKTAILLGSSFPLSKKPNAMAPHTIAGTAGYAPAGHLLSAVLARIFSAAAPAPFREVAISVLEVRDASPLETPSALARDTETVDLLSPNGRTDVFSPKASAAAAAAAAAATPGVRSSTGCFMREPSDLPAARYVYCHNAEEVHAVLAHGLAQAGTTWQPSRAHPRPATHTASSGKRQSTRASLSQAAASDSSGSDAESNDVLRPQSSQMGKGHLLVTLLVCASRTHSAVGVWKLWDLAGPSPLVSSSSLSTSADSSEAEGEGQEKNESRMLKRRLANAEEVNALSTRTHLGLAEVLPHTTPPLATKGVRSYANKRVREVALGRACAAADPVCRLVHGSLTRTTTLCTVVGVARQDAEAEAVNESVLRTCQSLTLRQEQGIPSTSEKEEDRPVDSCVAGRRQKANALAALRVLERFAVNAEDVLGYTVRPHGVPPALPQPPCAEEAAREETTPSRNLSVPTPETLDQGEVPATVEGTETPVDPLSINVTSIAPDTGEEVAAEAPADASGLSLLPDKEQHQHPCPSVSPMQTAALAKRDETNRRGGQSPRTPPSVPGTQRPSFSEKKRSLQRLRDEGTAPLEEGVAAGTALDVELFPVPTSSSFVSSSSTTHQRSTRHGKEPPASSGHHTSAAPTPHRERKRKAGTLTPLMTLQEAFHARIAEHQRGRPGPGEKSADTHAALLDIFTQTVQGFVADYELVCEENVRLKKELGTLRGTVGKHTDSGKPPFDDGRVGRASLSGGEEGQRQHASPTPPSLTNTPSPPMLETDATEAKLASLLSRAFRTGNSLASSATTVQIRKRDASGSDGDDATLPQQSPTEPQAAHGWRPSPTSSHTHSTPTRAARSSRWRSPPIPHVSPHTDPHGPEDSRVASTHATLWMRGKPRGTAATNTGRDDKDRSKRGGDGHQQRPVTISLEVTSISAASGSDKSDTAAPPHHDTQWCATLPVARSDVSYSLPLSARSEGREALVPAARTRDNDDPSAALRRAALRVQNCALQRGTSSSDGAEGDRELYSALRQLQHATSLVEAESRAAAEREREYLNMIL